MEKKLYVGGLSYSTTDDALREGFSQAGTVESATIIIDKMSGRSKGFGFVTFSSASAAEAAISEMNGKDISGRAIKVSEAKPMEERSERRSFGRRY